MHNAWSNSTVKKVMVGLAFFGLCALDDGDFGVIDGGDDAADADADDDEDDDDDDDDDDDNNDDDND